VALATGSGVACTGQARGAPTTATNSTATSSTAPATPTTAGTTTGSRSIADATAAIAAWAKRRQGIVDISIGDLRDGRVTDVTPGPQSQLRVASVMKVEIAVQFLRFRHAQKRDITADEIVKLGRMIEISDDNDANDLWATSGGPAGLAATIAVAGMKHTAYQPGRGWGFALTTAHDQALLATTLARSRLLDPTDTRFLLGLMRNVEPTQRFGFADSVDPTLRPAVKNGWHEDKDVNDAVWRVNCMAVFDTATLAHPFSIAVMTRYPANLGMAYGQDTCRGVAHLLGAWLTRK
jgi:hypothetical protein